MSRNLNPFCITTGHFFFWYFPVPIIRIRFPILLMQIPIWAKSTFLLISAQNVCKIIIFACQFQIVISPRLLGLMNWNLNPFWIPLCTFVFWSFPVLIIRIGTPHLLFSNTGFKTLFHIPNQNYKIVNLMTLCLLLQWPEIAANRIVADPENCLNLLPYPSIPPIGYKIENNIKRTGSKASSVCDGQWEGAWMSRICAETALPHAPIRSETPEAHGPWLSPCFENI